MKSNLQFDFVADKKNHTLTIKREFLAGRQLVWDAHTNSELLDQWFAPRPLTTKTRSMDFSEGGHWLYAMVDPTEPNTGGVWIMKKSNQPAIIRDGMGFAMNMATSIRSFPAPIGMCLFRIPAQTPWCRPLSLMDRYQTWRP